MAARVALIADVHGNRWALEAVLDDIERLGCHAIVNLGDCVYGPLDPSGTADLLMNADPPTVRGNQDRALVQGDPDETMRYVRASLSDEALTWFGYLPLTREAYGIFMCHGTPERDDEYLLESPGHDLVSEAELSERVEGCQSMVLACGHSHIQRAVSLSEGPLVLNPGSVGLPAYRSDGPPEHAMESGTPHARYAVIEQNDRAAHVTFRLVPYDWETAARAALANGRDDWASWIRTGRA